MTAPSGFYFFIFYANIFDMKVMIHAKNVDLSPSIETLVNQKIGTLGKFINRAGELVEARVEIGKPSKHHQKGPVFYAEINLKLGSRLFRATHEHMNLEYALVAARDEIKRQLQKFKTKRRDLGRKPND